MSDPDTLRNLMDELVEAGASGRVMAIVSSIIAVCLINSAPKTGAQRSKEYRDRKRADHEARHERDDAVTNVTQKEKVAPKEKTNPPENLSGFLSPKPKRDFGTRLPDPWNPPENLWEKAKSEGFSVEELRLETKKFRDHFCALPGPRARKLDWERTWLNWVRNSRNFSKKPPQTTGTPYRVSGPRRTWKEIREAKQGT